MTIKTVQGDIESSAINKVLVHEHIFNIFPWQCRNESESKSIEMVNSAFCKGYNLIVDLTPYTNVYNYYNVIDNSNAYIVSCTGFFTGKYVKAKYKKQTIEELCVKMEKDILVGVGKRHIKPGIIKIGTNTEDLKDFEERFFKSSILISNKYNLPIAVHLTKNFMGHYNFLLKNNVNSKKLMILHSEKNIDKMDYQVFLNELISVCRNQGYLQFSDFGTDTKSKKSKLMAKMIMDLIELGYINNILISNDCNWRWKKFKMIIRNEDKKNIRDYLYVENFVLPLLRYYGVREESIFKILHDNPIEFLGG